MNGFAYTKQTRHVCGNLKFPTLLLNYVRNMKGEFLNGSSESDVGSENSSSTYIAKTVVTILLLLSFTHTQREYTHQHQSKCLHNHSVKTKMPLGLEVYYFLQCTGKHVFSSAIASPALLFHALLVAKVAVITVFTLCSK